MAQARTHRLDFLALSDHNTVSGWGELESTDADGLLVIPSMEITTFRGHAVALGIRRWLEWRVGFNGWGMDDAARATRDDGGLFIVAHPNARGSPGCTGCRWEYDDLDWSLVDAVEVWSGPWRQRLANNRGSLRLWQAGQVDGRFPTAVAACDYHRAANWSGDGVPFTYIYASELSVPAVLEGIRRGRVVITSGPWLELQAVDAHGAKLAGIGDTLIAGGEPIPVVVSWKDVPACARCSLWQGDALLHTQELPAGGEAHLDLSVHSRGRLWAELRDADDALLTMTNAIDIQSGP